MSRIPLVFLRALALALVTLPPALTQSPYGSIVGRVADSQRAYVPMAAVRSTNLATAVQTATTTNTEGIYELRALIPGRYRIEVEVQGFKRFEREPIEVRVGDVLTLDVVLELGPVSERVTVTSEAPLLEASTSSLGQVVDSRRIHDLPRSGDSIIYLLQVSPGAAALTAPVAFYTPNNRGNTGSFTVSGSRPGWSLYTIDGNPINDSSSTTLNPIPEMIQEMRIQTNAVDASVGRFTGAHVNMVMKTGTNQFHGDVVFNFMNQSLIAKDYFTRQFINDPVTGPITQDKIDQAWPKQQITRFRPSASGPVYLPSLYDGRNRTFWSYGMDFMGFRRNEQGFETVPTAKQRQGDFSDLLRLGAEYQLYDPATISPTAGGRFQRLPLPGNIIPSNRINPMARQLLNYWPLPNVVGSSEGRNNYTDPQPNEEPYWSLMSRLDHAISNKQRLYASITRMHLDSVFSDPFHNGATGFMLDRNQRGVTLSDVITMRPNLILDLRYAINRYSEMWPSPSRGFDLAALGYPAALTSRLNPRETTLPRIDTGDYTAIGGGGSPYSAITYHLLTAQAMHISGAHSLHYGVESRILQRNRYSYVNYSPQFTFDSTWTNGPLDSAPEPPMGGGLAAFLLGVPSGGFIDRNPSFAQTSKYLSFYLQDDWKVSRNLTLNLGFRYEADFPTRERYDRTVRGFDFTTPNPIEAAARANYALNPISQIPPGAFRALGGLMFAGLQGVSRTLWDTDRNNFSPRIGLAYLIGANTVLRSSYGIFFEPLGADRNSVVQSGFERRTNLVPSLDNGQTFRATLANPFPDGILEPVGATAGLKTYLGQSIQFVWPTLREAYVQRWSFNIQQALPHQTLLDVGYVGSRGVGFAVSEDLNTIPRQYLSTSQVRDQPTINALSRQVPNPFFGLPEFTGTSLQSRTVATSQLLRPYPHFFTTGTSVNAGSTWYHSLQARAEKRFSKGWTLLASYTWSKFMEATARLNPSDPIPEHVISSSDRPHYFLLSAGYELPFGRGKRWLASRGWLDKVFGGWSVQALYTGVSGPPLSLGNILFYGNIKDIPISPSQRTVDRWFNVEAGFERSSQRQLASNIRTFPSRLSALRGDGVNCMNMSALKSFSFRERLSFRVEAEVLDVFNTPLWAGPSTSPTSSLFGKVSALQSDTTQRRATLGIRATW